MPTLKELLDTTTALHHHLCPRQVLGVRMGLYAGELLGLALPQADKRLYTIMETDGCAADGVAVATNCWVGRRTMRVEDYGKVAATFVDTETGQALRLAPRPTVRKAARAYAPQADNRWEAQLIGYQLMPNDELFEVRKVVLRTPIEQIISRPGRKALCAVCGEEIMNEREVVMNGLVLCRACAGESYYELVQEGISASGLDSNGFSRWPPGFVVTALVVSTPQDN
ncbi:MAG: FmdE family protein [Anaerolineae bacterium]